MTVGTMISLNSGAAPAQSLEPEPYPILKKQPLALTCGDPAGVGLEIIEAWALAYPKSAQEACLIGPRLWLDKLTAQGISFHSTLDVGSSSFTIRPGEPTVEGAAVALEALEAAAAGCRDHTFSAVVTAPVSKIWLQRVGFRFPGQTEFFADRWGGTPTMAFAGGRLRVVVATRHIPLREVPKQLNAAVLERAVAQAVELAQRLGTANPRIGVCGLNPHAGEEGLLGCEEQDFLNPQLTQLRHTYPGLSLCEPGDTLFWRHLQGEFDSVVALYHDQGLAPLKTLEFDQAVDITLGLPWVRTSPDHGTGFAIAGKNLATITSFANAVKLARQLSPASMET